MNVYVAGSLNMDLTIRTPEMPDEGVTIAGSGFMTTPGGKGANQAVAAARLGAKTHMVGCVGNAFGEELISSLKESGVNVDNVEHRENISSGIAMIIVCGSNNRIILDCGANGTVGKELIDSALKQAEAGDYLVLQLEIPVETVVYAMEIAKKKGMITVLNPAPAAKLPEAVYKNCDYFTPNQSEAAFYTGIYPKDKESACACAQKLLSSGVKNVLITMGEQGSVCIADGVFYRVEAFPVQAVDTTAAGDTYIGAFVTKLSEGAEVEEAMTFASAASALAVTKRGAQASIPAREEVEKRLRTKAW